MASGGGLTDLILRCLVFWFGFRCSSFEEGISTAFDGSENPQKGPLSTQIPLPRSMVERGRIGIPGNFRVLEVSIAEVTEGGNGIGWHQGWRTGDLFPDVFKDLCDLKLIGDEGDHPHWLPALASGQGIGFVDFPNPFRPA